MSDEKKTGGKVAPAPKGADGARGEKDVGHALRSVYSKTVNEEIPPELLDLLGKLN